MKRILAVSDTHGNKSALEKLKGEMEKADYIFHLGDHYYDIEPFRKDYDLKIYSVFGNCDGGGEEYILDINGFKIMLVHGDKYHVKGSLLRLSLRAQELNVNAVFYGHTHVPNIITENGITFINPGCMTRLSRSETYCVATLSEDGLFKAEIKELE